MQSTTFQPTSPPPLANGHHREGSDLSTSSTVISLDDCIIPRPNPPHRTLVLCFDGTGDQFNSKNSNVVKFFNMLVKNNPSQLVYYQPGIGTYAIPEVVTPAKAKISKIVDMMIGKHLDTHVMGGYEFLMQNYKTGDKICLFGFSRGAYTARALAGMVSKIGLIPRHNYQQVPFAYRMYSRDDKQGYDNSSDFKKTFSVSVDIEFVGVWDTVSSIGIIPRTLPFTRLNNHIRYFRHALSLDERRVRFKPTTWQRPNQRDKDMCTCELDDSIFHTEADVKEVWFAGHHCDIGGGSVENKVHNSLARIPLRWMIREIFKAKVGILFHRKMFADIGMDHTKLYPDVHARPDIIYHSPDLFAQYLPNSMGSGQDKEDHATIRSNFVSEELEDVADAISPANDQLQKTRWWWILEYTPQSVFYQDENNDHNDVVKTTINMGKGRYIPRKDGVKIHRSVDIRMKANRLEYQPKANLRSVTEFDWVD